MSGAKAVFSRIWGSDGSKGFKLAAWVTAAAGVGAWTYFDSQGKNKNSGVMGADEIDKLRNERNSKILADQKKKTEQ